MTETKKPVKNKNKNKPQNPTVATRVPAAIKKGLETLAAKQFRTPQQQLALIVTEAVTAANAAAPAVASSPAATETPASA